MMKQKVAMIVAAHEKWQVMKVGETELSDPSARLDSLEALGVTDGCSVDLYANAPKEEEEDIGELSDDPDRMEAEAEDAPALPEGEAMTKELTEEEEDKQNAFKGAAAELLEDGDKAGALAKLTEAVMVGNPSSMLLVKRGELLLKMKRPNAAVADTTAALEKNPDSCKGYKIRAKANRMLGKYSEANVDFSEAQKIDYDDDIVDVHAYCTKRNMWLIKKEGKEYRAKMAEKAEEAAAKAAKVPSAREKREAEAKEKAAKMGYTPSTATTVMGDSAERQTDL
jgi:suppressor of tumorigenicity protein 13